MLTLVFATALAAAPAPSAMPCGASCSPQAAMAADCTMLAPQADAKPAHHGPREAGTR